MNYAIRPASAMAVCLFFLCSLNAQVRFQKSFGGTQPEYGRWIEKTSDGNYIIAGSSKSYGAGNADFFVIKTDGNGDSVWIRTYGGGNLDEAYSIAPTNDNGYAIAGYTKSFGGGVEDVYLVRTDGNGNELWSKSFGDMVLQKAVSLRQTSDNGFIIGGYNFYTDFQFLLIKTDANGDTLWTHKYGASGLADVADQVIQTSDGGYAVIGYTLGWGAGNEDVWFLKTDASGNVQWGKTYGGNGNDYGYALQQTTDGGYIIAGSTNSFGAGDYDMLLVKTDASGDTLWSRTFGGTGTDHCFDVKQTDDGGYILAGKTKGFGATGEDCYLVKTGPNGNLLWSMRYGGNGFEHANSVLQMNNGGFLFAGYTDSYGSGMGDVYLVMTNDTGQSGCNEAVCNTLVSNPGIQLAQGQMAIGGVPQGNANTIQKSPLVSIEIMCWCDSLFAVSDFTYTVNNFTVDFTDASTAASSWYWTFGDSNSSSQQNPSHTYAGPGSYNACLIASNSCGDDMKCETINLFPQGFSEHTMAQMIDAYPNPANSALSVDVRLPESGYLILILSDMTGRTLRKISEHSVQGTYRQVFPLDKTAPGLYLLKVATSSGVTVRKILVR